MSHYTNLLLYLLLSSIGFIIWTYSIEGITEIVTREFVRKMSMFEGGFREYLEAASGESGDILKKIISLKNKLIIKFNRYPRV